MPKTWPHIIRNGDVAVKIYKNKGHIRGENFPTFLLSYFLANPEAQCKQSLTDSFLTSVFSKPGQVLRRALIVSRRYSFARGLRC